MAFHPYLNFGGNCREAVTRYQKILGGELELMSMADMPSEEEVPSDQVDLVMHAALKLDDGALLMASDVWDAASFGPVKGMYVNHTVSDMADAERIFAALADGGEVEMPFGATFWSPGFGVCVDRFGTPWMVDVDAPPT